MAALVFRERQPSPRPTVEPCRVVGGEATEKHPDATSRRSGSPNVAVIGADEIGTGAHRSLSGGPYAGHRDPVRSKLSRGVAVSSAGFERNWLCRGLRLARAA